MHGLGDHGTPSHDMDAPMHLTAAPVMGHLTTVSSAIPVQAVSDAPRHLVDLPSEPDPAMAMAGICLAVLAGAILSFLLLRSHRFPVAYRPLALRCRAPGSSGRRDRDPPCLFELSVLRN